MRIRLDLALTALLVASALGCSNGSCTTDDECYDSATARSLGRCFPLEAYCHQGSCKAACRATCSTANSTVNACSDEALVCTDARMALDVPFCTAIPIACMSADECPLYRPPGAAGAQSDWTCEGGVCRYPGFSYAADDLSRGVP